MIGSTIRYLQTDVDESRAKHPHGMELPQQRSLVEAIAYLVSVSVVSLGSLALVWVVLRNGNGQPLWLAWALAILSVVVGGSGARVEGRLSRRAASAA
jgi:hypothetical protein